MSKKDQEEALLEETRKLAPKGSKVEVRVTRIYSGMKRTMTFTVKTPDNEIHIIDEQIRQIYNLPKRPSFGEPGVIIGGTGMDMGLWAVHQLARKLYSDSSALEYVAVE